jgi:hypothetical protein
MHISLGVLRDDFPISMFLRSGNRKSVTIRTAPLRGRHSAGSLTFVTNPARRGGEWIIRDQRAHRHPAWSDKAGFPKTYSAKNPPYILVFRVGNDYHARFSTARQLAAYAPKPVFSNQKGILPTTRALLRHFRIGSRSTVEAFRDETSGVQSPPFDPKNVEDGRRWVLRAIHARQGQQGFRRKLIRAYGAQCAITRERAEPVLEAAHITPYMGPKTNATVNGLLLRADVHTLFDLALVSIDPETRKVMVSKTLKGTPYAKLHGKNLAEPHTSSNRPSTATLREHFSDFLP